MEQPKQQKPNNINPYLLEDAELALEKLTNQETQLIKEAEDLFKRQVDHIRLIDNLKGSIPNMEKVDGDTKRLSSLVDSSSTLVEDVCSKVRRIDTAKARLEDCLSKVGDILDLRICRNGMVEAMSNNNYEEAAMHIKRFLSIDQAELEKTIAIICGGSSSNDAKKLMKNSSSLLISMDTFTVPQPTVGDNKIDADACKLKAKEVIDPQLLRTALGELDAARIKLLALCQENITRAISEDNTKDIKKFFKIFPMLNEHLDGLQRYADYLRSKIVTQQVDETFKSKRVNQADKLAALYESIAKLIDSHQPLIETFYGPGYMIVVIRVLQKECDRLSRKILEEFRNETKLQYVAKIVRNSSMQPPSSYQLSQSQQTASSSPALSTSSSGTQLAGGSLNLQPSKLDPRDIDNILNEISVIVSRSEVYLNFIIQRIKEDINCKSEDETNKQASILELYNLVSIDCELNHLVQEVGGIYVMLEQFYLNESSKKAIIMDQIDVDSSSSGYCVSSMLDDIFFIIKKCTKRAISTKSNEVFCAIINHCVTLLEFTFCQVLEDRLKNQQYYSIASFTGKNLDLSQAYSAIQSGRYLQSASELEIAKAQYFSSLNNLDKACDYIQTFRGILDGDIKKLKPSPLVLEKQHDNQIEKSITCLNELSQLVIRFTNIINASMYQLFNASLRNRLRSELKVIASEIFDLNNNSDEELTNLAKNLLITLDKTLHDNLTSENYSRLVSIAKEFIASSLKTPNIK